MSHGQTENGEVAGEKQRDCLTGGSCEVAEYPEKRVRNLGGKQGGKRSGYILLEIGEDWESDKWRTTQGEVQRKIKSHSEANRKGKQRKKREKGERNLSGAPAAHHCFYNPSLSEITVP